MCSPICIGALVAGYFYKGIIENIANSYYLSAFFALVSLLYLWKKLSESRTELIESQNQNELI